MGMNIAKTVLLSLAMSGCALQDNQEDETYNEEPAVVYNIEIISLTNNKIEFNVIAVVPTPCNYYSSTEVSQENNDYYLKIYSRYYGETCLGVVSSI